MTGTIQQAAPKGLPPGTERSIPVTVNGGARDIPANSTIASLLDDLSLDARSVVVEHNGKILRDRDLLPSIALSSGDIVEIVHFVGGG